MSEDTVDFRTLLSEWLAVTADAEVSSGLSREEALGGAEKLYRKAAEGTIANLGVVDEASKDVLYAFVEKLELLTELNPEEILRIADRAYCLVNSSEWQDDTFGERRGLLARCARVGWRAIGFSVEEVVERRKAANAPQAFEISLTPIPWSTRTLHLLAEDDESVACSGRTVRQRSIDEVLNALMLKASVTPGSVASSARCLYRHLSADSARVGVFDEHEYLLGIAAFAAGNASRFTRDYEDCAAWLSRAESCFRQTLSRAPLLEKVAAERLCLRLDLRDYDHVLANAPVQAGRCDEFGLERDGLKSRLAELVALKETRRYREALSRLDLIDQHPGLASQAAIRATARMTRAEILSVLGQYDEADKLFAMIGREIDSTELAAYAAHFRALVAESYRDRGRVRESVENYRIAAEMYSRIGMSSWAAYIRIMLAEVLIMSSRHEEAEIEILSALPAIDEKKLAQEGMAALALLRESVRRRKTDRDALRQLREHLKKRI